MTTAREEILDELAALMANGLPLASQFDEDRYFELRDRLDALGWRYGPAKRFRIEEAFVAERPAFIVWGLTDNGIRVKSFVCFTREDAEQFAPRFAA